MSRFGLQIPNFSFGVPNGALFDRVAEIAHAAEDSGFDSVWVMDHLYQLPALGGPSQPMLEAYTLLGAIGARTSRMRVGSLVTGVTYRNPAFLGKVVTTLDIVTSGRAILGLGAAWYDVEHEAFGFEFPSTAERFERLEEAVQICRSMMTQEATTFDGVHYRTKGLINVPRPVASIPLMIGGGGEKKTLRLVAQYADMCNLFGTPETIRHKVSVLRSHCEDVGRDPSDIRVTRLGTMIPTETSEQAAAARENMTKLVGDPAKTMLIGTQEDILSQIDELEEAGVDYFIFNMPGSDPSVVARTGEWLAARLG